MTKVCQTTENSKQSYAKQLGTGRLDYYKGRIYAELLLSPKTRRQLADKVGAKNPSDICGALSLLENQGIISKIDDVYDNSTGRTVCRYAIKQRQNPLYINRDSFAIREPHYTLKA